MQPERSAHEHDHGDPHGVDLEAEDVRSVRRLGVVLALGGLLLIVLGVWLLS